MRAVQQETTLKELLTSYIQAGMIQEQIRPKVAERNQNNRPLPIGIERIPGTPLHPAMSNAELHAILEEEDLAE